MKTSRVYGATGTGTCQSAGAETEACACDPARVAAGTAAMCDSSSFCAVSTYAACGSEMRNSRECVESGTQAHVRDTVPASSMRTFRRAVHMLVPRSVGATLNREANRENNGALSAGEALHQRGDSAGWFRVATPRRAGWRLRAPPSAMACACAAEVRADAGQWFFLGQQGKNTQGVSAVRKARIFQEPQPRATAKSHSHACQVRATALVYVSSLSLRYRCMPVIVLSFLSSLLSPPGAGFSCLLSGLCTSRPWRSAQAPLRQHSTRGRSRRRRGSSVLQCAACGGWKGTQAAMRRA